MLKGRVLAWGLSAVLFGAASFSVQAQVTPQLEREAVQGDAKAQYELGAAYYHGDGALQDFKQAAHWFIQAAEQGSALGQSVLGSMYLHGEGVPQDTKQGYAWLSVATANGYGNAKNYRDLVAQILSPKELSEGQALAAEYFDKYQPSNP